MHTKKANQLAPGDILNRWGVALRIVSIEEGTHPIGGKVVKVSHTAARSDGQGVISYKPEATVELFDSSDFDALAKAQQDIQKRHAFGSREHKRAYDTLRGLVLNFKGQDIGGYQ